MPKVLISDIMSPRTEEVFQERGVDVDVITGMSSDELKACISEYDGLAVRSSTKVTADIIEVAKILKIIGRASPDTNSRGCFSIGINVIGNLLLVQ